MRMMARIGMVLALGVFGLASCGGGDDDAPIDAGVTVDASTPANYAGCTTFMDLSAAGATRTITAMDTLNWSPKCIQIKAGQSVTWSFTASHPLSGAAANPTKEIVDKAVGPATYTLSGVGTYGFYCQVHGLANGSGMAGAVKVVP